jgi:L-Ala-D/L-Glu epimerase
MNLTRVTFTSCVLPFRRPLATARGALTSRRIILIAITDDEGHIGIGEAAPLPDFGTENFDRAWHILGEFTAQSHFAPVPAALSELAAWREQAGVSDKQTPALSFGIEAALASLLAQRAGLSLSKILNPSALAIVRVNAVIGGGTTEEALHSTHLAAAEGFDTFKIKTGARSVRGDIETLRTLHKEFPEFSLRVDANSAWDLDEARQFAHGTAACDLEFIEDPLKDRSIETLRVLRKGTEVPIALDECARRPEELHVFMEQELCDVVMLKPAAVGSFAALESIAAEARERHVEVVLSSLFESSIGLAYAATCAAALGSIKFAHGLGTAGLLATDVLPEPLLHERGVLAVPDIRVLAARLDPPTAHDLGVPLP